MIRRTLLLLTTAAVAAATTVGLAAPASAHVRVSPDQATPGSYAVLTFRVPTESATASTTQVALSVPTDTPLSTVSYQPVPGWSVTVTTSPLPAPVTVGDATLTEAVTRVVWKADDAASAIAPGQFQQFTVTAGPVPDTGKIVLPVAQTYSDGSVVDWSQETPTNGAEPENPAPVLYVEDAPPAGSSAAPSTSAASSSDGGTSATTVLAAGALLLAVVAVVLAGAALRRGGRTRRPVRSGGEGPASAPRRADPSEPHGDDTEERR